MVIRTSLKFMASSTILQIASKYSLYTDCVTCAIGLIGNALSILVFTRLKCFRNNRCALYLTIESICNFINRLVSIILTIATSIYGDSLIYTSLTWCRLRYIMSQSCALVAFSMICFAAADQFFSTNYRFNLRQMCTLKLAQCLVFTSIAIWFFHSLLFGFFVNIEPLLGCTISNPIWIQYSTFFFYPVLAGLLPIVIASSFSLLAFRNVRQIVRRQIPIERRRFDRQITAMVLVRVVFFVFFTLPYTSYRIYAINTNVPSTNVLRYAIERLIQVIFLSFGNLNYTISFYLFLVSSSRYRRQVKCFLTKKCWRRWIHWCCVKENQVAPENPTPIESSFGLE